MATITGTSSGETLNGTADADVISALAGNDTVNALGGNDTVFGGDGRDTLNGGNADDVLHGEGDKDTQRGEAGNDTLIGGGGQDRLAGGAGNDTFVYLDASDSTIAQQDVIQDFTQGQDRIDLAALMVGSDLVWGGTAPTTLGVWYGPNGTNTNVYVDLTGDAVADFRIQVNGTVAFTLDDFLGVVPPGGGGPVAVNDADSASEDDVLSASGNVLANDSGASLSVTAVRFGASHGIVGSPLAGTYGSLTLNADGSYVYTLANGTTAVQGLAGGQVAQDVFTYTASGPDGDAAATLTLTITGANDGATITGRSDGSVTEDGATIATGTITATDADAGQSAFQPQGNVAGTYGTFTLASDGAWTYALQNAAANVQALHAGQRVADSFTVTTLDGSASQRITIAVDGASDAVNPVIGTNAGETLTGTAAANFIDARGGDDVVNALGGGDEVHGGDGRDTLNGGEGNDTLHGDGNKDLLRGEAGDDTLIGGAAQDRLAGGAGNDTFVYLDASDSTIAQQDVIQDFTQGQDRIDVSALLGPVDLLWGGTIPTANGIWYGPVGATTNVYVDLSGDAIADFRIQVNGSFAFTTGDFIGVGRPPEPTPAVALSDQVVTAASAFSLAIPPNLFIDPDGGTLQYTASLADGGDLPAWLAFDPRSFQLSGTAPAATDVLNIRITATDAGGLSASSVFQLTSNQAPALARGLVTTDLSGEIDQALAVIRQADGRLVLAGYGNGELAPDFALARYNESGALDPTFGGGDGIVTTAVGPDRDVAWSVVEQPDGRLVVAGQTFNGNDQDIALARYDAHGALDPTFGGGDGIVTTDIGGADDTGRSLLLQDDGGLVVAGRSGSELALLRYDADGVLDPTFGGDGIVTLAFGSTFQTAYSVIQQADGKLVVSGATNETYPDPNTGDDVLNGVVTVLRFNQDGTLDPTFGGGDGIVTTDLANLVGWGGSDAALSVFQQADGKLVVGGYAADAVGQSEELDYSLTDFALVRYLPDGTPDPAFGGGDGIVITDLLSEYQVIHSVIETSGGELLAAGTRSAGEGFFGDFVLLRYAADGTLLGTFGGGIQAGRGELDPRTDVIEQPDGRFVVAVPASRFPDPFNEANVFGIARFNADGTADESFLAIGDQTVPSDSAFSMTVPESFFTDPEGGELVYSLTRADGGPLPAWLTFDGATRTFSGSPPLGADDATLRLTATDPLGASTSVDFTLSVIDLNGGDSITLVGAGAGSLTAGDFML